MPFESETSETDSQKKYKLEMEDLEAQGEEILMEDANIIDQIKLEEELNTQEEDKQ